MRRPGGGRRAVTVTDPQLLAALTALIEPVTRGDPESPLRWTCKSTATLADELTRQRHPVSDRTVAALLKEAGYSLQGNRKTREAASHPDRDAQFAYLNDCVTRFLRRGHPAISVDTNYDRSRIMDRTRVPSRAARGLTGLARAFLLTVSETATYT